MTDRQRIRRGRTVSYYPTAAEETASGVGPWMGMITTAHADGTVDLMLDVPTATPTSAAALASPLIAATDQAAVAVTPPPTPADGAYVQAEATATADSIAELHVLAGTSRTMVNELKADVNIMATLVNELRAVSLNTRKVGVVRGTQAGQFDLLGTGPQAL